MAQDFFRVERGFADENVVYISGNGAPVGTSGDTLAAPVGSHYTDSATGNVYHKTGSAGVAGDWERLLDQSDYDTLSNLVGGGVQTVIDEVNAIETSVGLNSDGTYSAPAGNYINTATTIKGALVVLDSQVKTNADAIAAETAARIAADSAEVTARNDAIAAAAATAASQLATETQARLDGDAALTTSIAAVQAELDAAELAVGLNTDGTYTAPAGTYVGGTTSVKTGLAALDTGLTTEVADRTAAVAAVASALANEAQLRADGDAALQTQIQDWVNTQIALDNTSDEARVAAEAALRIAKDDALQAEIDRVEAAVGLDTDGNIIPISGTNYLDGVTTVFGGAFALDTQLKVVTDGLAAEVSARQAADTTINASIATETQARTDADSALQQELDSTQAGAGLESDGSYVAPSGSTYLGLAVSLKDADSKLDVAIKNVSDAVVALQGSSSGDIAALQAALSAEQAARIAADSSEQSAREAADQTLQLNLSAEQAARIAADSAEQTARQDADTALQAAIDAEEVARAAADSAINTKLDKARTESSATGVVAATNVDSVNALVVGAAKWMVRVAGTGVDAGKVVAFEVFALNDSDGSAVTSADFTVYAKLRIGGTIAGLDVSVEIESGNMVLKVTSTNGVNVKAVREIIEA